MRIEVLVDVKTTLGEGPLWGCRATAALLDRFHGWPGFPSNPMTGVKSGLGPAGQGRFDRDPQGWQWRDLLSGEWLSCPRFSDWRMHADP